MSTTDNKWYYWAATFAWFGLLAASVVFLRFHYFDDIYLAGVILLATYSYFAWKKEKFRNARYDFFVQSSIAASQLVLIVNRLVTPRPLSGFIAAAALAAMIALFVLLIWHDRKNKTWIDLSNYELLFEYRKAAMSLWRAEGKPPPSNEEIQNAFSNALWAYFTLKRRDPSDGSAAPLLNDEDARGQILAARTLTWRKREEWLKALDDLAKRTDAIGAAAKDFMKQWRAGEVKPIPEPEASAWERQMQNRTLPMIARKISDLWKSFWRDNTE